jgi:hypothetical protein
MMLASSCAPCLACSGLGVWWCHWAAMETIALSGLCWNAQSVTSILMVSCGAQAVAQQQLCVGAAHERTPLNAYRLKE